MNNKRHSLLPLLLLASVLLARPAAALNLGTQPLYLGSSIPPIVMLMTPKDHQLFKKAYDDFSDLDGTLPGGDTALETTYKHSIDYYGYFDPYKCYVYDNSNQRFAPSYTTASKYCNPGTAWAGNFLNWASMARIDIMRKLLYGGKRSTDTNALTVLERELIPVEAHAWAKHYRGSDISQLVPFANMTSSDLSLPSTSSMFLGGVISVTQLIRASGSSGTKTATATVASNPFNVGDVVTIAGVTDSGSGNVNGNRTITSVTATSFSFNISVTSSTSPPTTMSGTITATLATPTVSRSFTVTLPAGGRPFIVGDQLTVAHDASNYMVGEITAVTGASGTVTVTFMPITVVGSGTYSSWTVTNWSYAGITICNATQATSGTSNASTAPPLLRAAWGDYTLWAVADGTACRWSDESGGANGNKISFTEIKANSKAPPRAASVNANLNVSGVTNGDYVARVEVCNAALVGTERCAQYPNGNLKPIGLLQDYAAGQQKKIKFGLFTGSFMKNKSGGVLRKNPDFLDSATTSSPSNFDATKDEINPDSGIFNTSVTGIIRTFNALRLYGYTFATGTGSYSTADGCGLLNPDPTEGICTSWGNPLSEMFVESLRYLAGASGPTSAFTYTEAAGQKDYDLGLRQPRWSNPLTQQNYCTPLNVIVMNASVNSYDNDQVPTDLWSGGTTAQTLTDTVGDLEGISGNFLIGNNGTTNNGLCNSKSVGASSNKLGELFGICPEAPALRGSFQLVGAAYWAHTNKIRTDLTVPAGDTKSLKVTTYGVALASAVPSIQIPVPGSNPTRYVTIQPTDRTYNGSIDRGHGSIVDFKVVRQDLAGGTGKFFVSWEDSTQGNDYDLDSWGYISYRFVNSNTQIEVTTDVVYAAAGHSLAFGYVISGTASDDGAHFHSAHEGNQIISYNFPSGFTTTTSGNNECNRCRDEAESTPTGPTSKAYNLSASGSALILKEPLWYASKYGGFTDVNGDNKPDSITEWDGKINLTGGPGTDGNPDNFFPVTNPGALQQSLDRAFINVLQVSSASSVATNSTSLQSGSIVYQARFNANEWSGQLLAFGISTTGAIDPIPLWDASQLMPAANSRTIVTFSQDTATPYLAGSPHGVPFRWTNMNSLQQADLNKSPVGVADPAGPVCTGVTSTGFTPAGCTLQGSLRLNYVRGDQTNEGATANKYRVRPTTVLGDIVDSTPVYVGPPSLVQYGDFSPPAAAYSSDASYTTYIGTSAIANRTPMIYTGANDGMLHGFDASTAAAKGIEKLAFVPSTSYRNITKLTDKTYSHRYFVDGSPTVADVKFSDGTWHTILVGGLNAGGQGIYALDITNPANFSEGNADNIVLWEFNDITGDYNLGNTYSQPTVAKVKDGAGFKYVVIFGNGWNSTVTETGDTAVGTGCPTLYMVVVDGPGSDRSWDWPTDWKFVDATADCAANGLATPKVVDVDNDGYADYAYAGDLHGHVWKFDIRDWNNPQLAFGPTAPFFTAVDPAGNPQPITTGMTAYPGPVAGSTMILFGTGKYLEQSDDSGPFQTQTFYGLLDKNDGSTIASVRNASGVYPNLMQQKVLGASPSNPLGTTTDNPATPVDEGGFRITTPYQPNYTGSTRTNTQFGETNPAAQDATATTPPQSGWYMDFPYSGDYGTPTVLGTGERVAFRPIISSGKVVITTLVPSTVPCESGGTSFIMDLDPRGGNRLSISPFDLNGDLNFNTADFIADPAGNMVAVSGKASTIGIVPTPTVIQMTPGGPNTPGREVKVLSGSSGALMSVLELGGGPTTPGAYGRRIQWRQLFTD